MKMKSGNRFDCIGMVHLLPLPGSPKFDKKGGMQAIIDRATTELGIYAALGFDGAIFENYGDAPFFPSRVPPETVASMVRVITSCMHDVASAIAGKQFSIGINVLRNDAVSALAIANAVGGHFIRVNIHAGASATDQGIINGTAHETLRYRSSIVAGSVAIYADVLVKHATPLLNRSLLQESIDLVQRALVDGALIFTGDATGARPPENVLADIPLVKKALPGTKLLIGSGMTADNVGDVYESAGKCIDGCIVGTSLKTNGDVQNIVDKNRVAAFVGKVQSLL
nr:BtpA/SgcQ family protein [Candidatus Sigynarchaeota archaeon]